jgi:hypothetical protein
MASFPVVPVVSASLMGLVFGFALEKARVFEPHVTLVAIHILTISHHAHASTLFFDV